MVGRRAAVVHLCAAESARGKGVTRLLVEHLKYDTTASSHNKILKHATETAKVLSGLLRALRK